MEFSSIARAFSPMPHQWQHKITHGWLLVYLLCAAILLTGFGSVLIESFQETALKQKHQEKVKNYHENHQRLMFDELKNLTENLELVKQTPVVLDALKSGDKQALQQAMKGLYEMLQKTHQVNQLCFMSPDGVVVLRMHLPSVSGNFNQHGVFLQALQTQQNAYGFELGNRIDLMMRVATPWFVDNQLVGYIEIGRQIDGLIDQLSNFTGIDAFYAVDNRYLDQPSEFLREKLSYFRELGQSRLLIDQEFGDFELLEEMANQKLPSIEKAEGERFLIGSRSDLIDSYDNRLGNVYLIADLSAEKNYMEQAAFLYTLTLGVGLLALAYFGSLLFLRNRRLVLKSLNLLSQEKRKAQDLLIKHDLATEQNALAYWEYSVRRHCILVSEVGLGLLGYPAKANQWRPVSEWQSLIHPEDCSDSVEQFKSLLLGHRDKYHSIQRVKHFDGHYRWLDVRAVVYATDSKGRVLESIGLFKDITDEVKIKDGMLEARRLAEQANEAKSQFLANMSHEIRTPLNGVIGLTDLTLRTELTSQQRGYLEQALSSSKGLLRIINEILDFSKIDAGKMIIEEKPFYLEDVLHGAVNLFLFEAKEKQLDVSVKLDLRMAGVLLGDGARIAQVINNLVSNAIKFTEKGSVKIEGKWLEETPKGLTVEFSVKDTGMGIEPESFKELFQPFSQLETSRLKLHGGTGLGLSICKHLVELMGGRIWVESEVGQGSTFFFSLTLKKSAPTSLVPQSKMLNNGLSQRKFLLIEDGSGLALQVGKILNAWNYPTRVINDCLSLDMEGIELQAYDYVMFGWRCPEKTGSSLLGCLKKFEGFKCKSFVLVDEAGRIAMQGLQEQLNEPLPPLVAMPTSPSSLFDALGLADLTQALHSSFSIEELKLGEGNVLVAEDNKVNQMVIRDYLESFGCHVTLVDNGQQAVEALQNVSADFYQAVIMDIQMPEMDGYEATRVIRGFNNEVPIVAVSAAVLPSDRNASLLAGMNAHLGKPIDPKALFHELSHFCGQRMNAAHNLQLPLETDKASHEAESLGSIEGWDGQQLLNNLQSESLLLQLLETFLEEHQKDLLELKDAETSGELRRRIVHSLKGVTGDLQFSHLMTSAKALLDLAHPLSLEEVEGFCRQLEQTFKEVQLYLEARSVP